jgi:prevent-host-death family protein
MRTIVATSEAKNQFSKLIQRVAENGEQFIVEHKGRPVAVIIGIEDFKRLGHLEKDAAPEDAQEEKVQRLARRLGSRYQLPKKKQQRLFELIDRQEKGALSAVERKALHRLLKECDELMLKRARALDGPFRLE